MWKWILLVSFLTLPLAAQEVNDQQRQIDDLRSQLEETQARLDSLVRTNNPIDLGARITEAFESGSNLASFTLWFVSIIGGLLVFVLGFFGFKEIRKAGKIRDEAQTAKQKAEEFAEKTEKCAIKAEELLKKLEERTKRLDEVESKVESVESRFKPAFFSGLIAVNTKKYKEALEHFEQAIVENPKNAEAWSQKGYCLGELSRYDEAINALNEAIKYKPNKFETHYNLACAQVALRKYKEALDNIKKAKEIKGDEFNTAFAWQDPDLEPLRTGKWRKRFIEIVGPPQEGVEKS
jgi:tetratricopeptide (TPR) repeat protein